MTMDERFDGRQSRVARHAMMVVMACLALGGAACSDDGRGGEGGGDAQPAAGAVLLAERFNTPDGRAAYLGVFPDVPTTQVDIAQMIELGPEGDVFGCGGDAFFYNPDAGSITKYEVADDLTITPGPSLDVLQEGITGWTGAHVCASAERAFIFNETGGRVVEWNPTTMVIVDAFDVPTADTTYPVQFFEPKIAGDLVYFSLTGIDWDTMEVEPRAMLAVFDLRDRSLSFDYDDRCQASLGGAVDSAGNYYQLPEDGGFWSTYAATPDLPPDCVLRVPAGGKTFDDGYALALPEGQSLRAMWPVDDGSVLAALIPIADAPPAEDMWSWYELPITPTLLDLASGATSAYASLPPVQPMNSRKIVVDGQSYYQVYSFDADGLVTKIDLVKLTPAGAEPQFTLVGGDILTLERLR